MKFRVLYLCFITALFTNCEKEEGLIGEYQYELKGEIQEMRPTWYIYGTHQIRTNSKTYPLKSNTIDLDKFLNKKVTIWGDNIQGYPVDGGPDYIEVKRIKK
ncbi:MAG: hypothetical protein ACO1OF_13080 [Adhaeribacter sp.]